LIGNAEYSRGVVLAQYIFCSGHSGRVKPALGKQATIFLPSSMIGNRGIMFMGFLAIRPFIVHSLTPNLRDAMSLYLVERFL